jgi:hypothetical protein
MEELDRIPIGTRQVGEAERKKTLNDLVDARDEIITALERFPLQVDTNSRSTKLG